MESWSDPGKNKVGETLIAHLVDSIHLCRACAKLNDGKGLLLTGLPPAIYGHLPGAVSVHLKGAMGSGR